MYFKSIRRLLGIASLFYLFNPNLISNERKATIDDRLNFPSHEEFMSLYTNCNHRIYSEGRFDFAKAENEILQGVLRRKRLENFLIAYFKNQTKDNLDGDAEGIYYPLGKNGSFENSFDYPRIRFGKWKEKHRAIDIFSRVGSEIFSPVEGVVIDSSDNWVGRWDRKKGFVYEGGGLSSLSGNGVILFDPRDRSYYFMIHMKDVFVRTGDIVSKGRTRVGTVGKTGNSISPRVVPHLHIALKRQGRGCSIEGVLVPQNPYPLLRDSRNTIIASNRMKSRVRLRNY